MRTARLRCAIVLASVLGVVSGCAPPAPEGVRSPIIGTLEAGESVYQANYFSPSICAPIGTQISISISGNEHNAAAKLMTDADQTISGLTLVPVGGGSVTLVTTTSCFTVFLSHFAFGTFSGDDLDYVITWPV